MDPQSKTNPESYISLPPFQLSSPEKTKRKEEKIAMEISAPLKTLSKTPFLSSPSPSHSRHYLSRFSTPSRRLATPTVAMASEIRSSCSSAALLSADPRRRDQVLSAAVDSLSNCLSETHLDKTVPGLKSKARGKVSSTVYSLIRLC